MLVCTNCNKQSHRISWSRHKKGSSGATEWPLKGPITKRLQKPNLHLFKGKKYCTKCLRQMKATFSAKYAKQEQTPIAI